jgi:putative tryptophan/tyrosine transport system substrate-binding protein
LSQIESTHLGWPIGLFAATGAAALAGVLGMFSNPTVSQKTDERPQRVVFAGPETAETDSRYAQFQKSAERLNPAWRNQATLSYAHVSVDESEQTKQEIAAALAGSPKVLVASNATSALVAIESKPRVNIVFSSAAEPVGLGLVKSHRQPGAGITGVSVFDELDAKRLELLRDAFPSVRRIGVLADDTSTQFMRFESTLAEPAAALGLVMTLFRANSVDDVHRILRSAEAAEMHAWYVPRNYPSFIAEREIIEHIRRLNIPAIHATEQEMRNGALMAYIQDRTFMYDAMADLTLRILHGEDAGSIPVQRPKKFILAVRPRDEPGTPQINPSVIRRADKVY